MAKTESGTKPWRARLGALGRVGTTLLVIFGAAIAVQIGVAELGKRAEAAPDPEAAGVIAVSVSRAKREPGYTIDRAFIGQVEAQLSTLLSFELPGRLDRILVDEGARVTKGQLLAEQDTALLLAERAQLQATREATQAQLTFADLTVERRSDLTTRGFTSQAGLDEARAQQDELRARIAQTDAALENVAIRIAKAQLHAPFDGQVTSRTADGGETLGAGQGILGLLETSAPQVRIGVPLDLTARDLSDPRIEVSGVEQAAELVALRPDIDPVTRTRTALFRIAPSDQPVFGQIARLIVRKHEASEGVWVPVSSLKEGTRGQWTVLVVDPDYIVRRASVEILHAETDRVFVRGALPEGTPLISAGPQRVTVGQRVTMTFTE